MHRVLVAVVLANVAVRTGAFDWLVRGVSEMVYCVSTGTSKTGLLALIHSVEVLARHWVY